MKLGKLLAAGKSVMNGRKEVSYRASKQVYLPKFGPASNPFKSPAEEPAAEAPPKETGQVSEARPTRLAVSGAPAATMSQASPAPSRPPAFSPVSGKKTAVPWASRLNPASIFRGRTSGNKSADSSLRGQKQPTQTELSLDSVKVLHNDLTDVDVEIVPIKSRSGPADLPPPKKSWEFLGERLFGVEAT